MRHYLVTFGLWAVFMMVGSVAWAQGYTVCQTTSKCMDILDRHGPDSFDYDVLSDNILRLNGQARSALLKRAAKNEANALQLLARPGFRWTPKQHRQLAEMWPGKTPVLLKPVLLQTLSPLVRDAVIQTLNSDDAEVQTLSREIVTRSVAQGVNTPLGPQIYVPLSKALLSSPTPALVTLIATYPVETSRPLLTRALRSGDSASVIAAYEALFTQDPAQAFNALISTLKDMTDVKADEVMALSDMLQARHTGRADGYYLGLAKKLATDTEMSRGGRAVGVDMALSLDPKFALALPDAIAATQKVLARQPKRVEHYVKALERHTLSLPEAWVPVFLTPLQQDTSGMKARVIALLGRKPIPAAQTLIQEALDEQQDWRVLRAAILATNNQGRAAQKEMTRRFGTHPFMPIRIAAQGRKPAQQITNCPITATQVKRRAQKLPYFDEFEISPNVRSKRFGLVSGEPMSNHWLAGFDVKDADGQNDGGIVTYNYVTGEGRTLVHGPVLALVPQHIVPLGQTATSFWAILTYSNQEAAPAIYRVDDTPSGPKASLFKVLPATPVEIEHTPTGHVVIGFDGGAHRPITLTPTGQVFEGCYKRLVSDVKGAP